MKAIRLKILNMWFGIYQNHNPEAHPWVHKEEKQKFLKNVFDIKVLSVSSATNFSIYRTRVKPTK